VIIAKALACGNLLVRVEKTKGEKNMKILKLIGIGFLSLLVSFFVFFAGLEAYKHTSGAQLFRAQNPYDLVIKNARIIDGTGGEIYRADIGIRDNIIIKIGKRLNTEKAKIFDAAGYTVAPHKVEWVESLGCIKRDLASALVRYPENRIIISKAKNSQWEGKSVKALLSNPAISKNILEADRSAVAFISPVLKETEANDINTAYYQISGWRGELLAQDIGKIKPGFPASLVIFNHRELNNEKLLDYLLQEKLPPLEFAIEGSDVQSTKTDS